MIVSKKSVLNIFKKWNVDLTKVPHENEKWIDAFSSLGIEVESIESNRLSDEEFSVVRILDYINHPNSDHMHICTVCDGAQVYEIVCGAANVRVGMYTIMARLHATMPDGMKIEPRKLRGVESRGMLCSLGELNPAIKDVLSDVDNAGIVDLEVQGNKNVPFELAPGAKNWKEYLMLEDDIFDLTIATNAGYLNALFPIAISLLSYWNLNYSLKANSLVKQNMKPNQLFEDLGILEFNEKNDYASYELRMECAHNLLKAKDKARAYASILMFYYGLPFLAISKKCFVNDQIDVAYLSADTTVTVVSGKEKIIPNNTLVLKANGQIMALPGFFNLKETDPALNDEGFVLLYSINDWYKNAQLKKKLDTSNYASYLSVKKNTFYFFNKFFATHNVFPSMPRVLVYTCTLTPSFRIRCSENELFNKLLNNQSAIDRSKIMRQLSLLGLNYDANNKEFIIPGYRVDLENDNDLIEEALRFVNVNTLAPEPIQAYLTTSQNTYEYDTLNRIRDYLISLGFFETKTYKLTSKTDFDAIKNPIYNSQKQVLINPVSSEREVLKHTLSTSLREVIQYNLNQKNYLFENIFEIEQLYWTNNETSEFVLGMLVTKDLTVQNKFKVNSLKTNVVFELVNAIGYIVSNKKNLFTFTKIADNEQYINLYEISVENKKLGFCGVFKKPFENNFLDKNYPSYMVELNVQELLAMYEVKDKNATSYKPIIKNPSVSRDVNVNLALNNTEYFMDLINLQNELKQEVKEFDELKVKDIFMNQNEQKKVLTLNYVLIPETNMKKEEINKLEEQVSTIINKYFN